MPPQTKLTEWFPWRREDLDALLRSEGLGGRALTCTVCSRPGVFRCRRCSRRDLFCRDCLLATHARHSLHRVEVCFPPPLRPVPHC